MKNRTAVFLCCLLVCSALSAGAANEAGGFTYRLADGGEVAITGYAGSDANPVIPSAIGGHPVTGIDDWALSYNSTIHSITVPASVVAIGDFAFAGCGALAAIGVEEGNPAFGSADGVLYDRSMIALLAYPGGREGAAYTLPSGTLFIGAGAFAACGQLEEVNLPEGLVSIGRSAFEDCSRLRRVRLSESLAEIGEGAFRYCGALERLFVPPGVRRIAFSAFEGCERLTLAGPEGSYAQAFAGPRGIPFASAEADWAPEDGPVSGQLTDLPGLSATLWDWILGSSWGVQSGAVNEAERTLTLGLSAGSLETLSLQDRADIRAAMVDILALHLPSREAAESYTILYRAQEAAAEKKAAEWTAPPPYSGQRARENLIFIHHSVGENWLKEGMAKLLNERGYHVADVTYGWREYGDHTDTADWPTWFTDRVMELVYRELGTMSADNSLSPAMGENRIVMFKSCYPNSDVGDSIADEMALYNSLLPYFESRPDKMFILVTPPPMTWLPTPGLTRQLTRWLIDREGGWLAGLSTGNVFVYDLYNVLTHPDAHHRLVDGREEHRVVPGADLLFYDWDGDNHPNPQGSRKAAEEFVPLMDRWYAQYLAAAGEGQPR